MGKRLDITDEIYGRLQAIVTDWYKTKETGLTYWFCQCECGNIVSVYLGHLKNGHSESCGCLQKENMSKIGKSARLDITGQIFGRLQVIVTDWYKTKETGHTHWFCQCEDNNIVSVFIDNLKSGATQSCGCLNSELASKRSSGKNNPKWKNGITPFYTKIRNSKKYKEFVQITFKQVNYICQLSGEKSKGDLQVHHKKGFAKILEENNITTIEEAENCKELWDENNVVVLKEKWHSGIKTYNPNAFHRIYGTVNFTEEDFYRWFEEFKIEES